MSNLELFSVAIPLYNKQTTILRTLKSISDQIKYVKEVIIIDDFSNDSSYKVAKEFIYNEQYGYKYKLFALKENHGPSYVRNVAIKKCTAEYISFIDSDDFYLEHYFEKCFNIIKKFNAKIIVNQRKKLSNNEDSPKLCNIRKYLTNTNISNCYYLSRWESCIYWNNIFGGSGTIVFATKLSENISFPENDKLFEDWYFYYRLFCRAKENQIVFLNEANICIDDVICSLASKRISIDDIKEIEYLKLMENSKIKKHIYFAWLYNQLFRLSFKEGCSLLFKEKMNILNRLYFGKYIFIFPIAIFWKKNAK